MYSSIPKLLFFSLLLVAMSCKNNQSGSDQATASLNLIVIGTSDYCGGANPPEQLLQELRTPKPLENSELILVSQGDNIKKGRKITTDQNGQISLNLTPGDYQLFFPEKLNAKAVDSSYETVCANWAKAANGSFTFASGQEEVNVSVKRTCNPCAGPAQ